MRLTDKQTHVLANLDRVEPLQYKVHVRAPIQRYQLDGVECTEQINGLVVKELVVEQGRRLRRNAQAAQYMTRQPASSDTVRLMRAILMSTDA